VFNGHVSIKSQKGLATRHKLAANAQYDHRYFVPHECAMLLSYLWKTDPIDLVLLKNIKGEVAGQASDRLPKLNA
jgi:hypothetical protein